MRKIVFALLMMLSVSAYARDPLEPRTIGAPSDTMLYIFTSWDCPHCRDWHKNIYPEIVRQFIKTKRAQLIFVDMAYTEKTLLAAQYVRCMDENKAEKMSAWLYKNQNKWNTENYKKNISHFAHNIGFTGTTEDDCLKNKELVAAIKNERDRYVALYKVHGWPTIALRRGNSVRLYSGTDTHAILNQLDRDMREMVAKDK